MRFNLSHFSWERMLESRDSSCLRMRHAFKLSLVLFCAIFNSFVDVFVRKRDGELKCGALELELGGEAAAQKGKIFILKRGM